jgi:hydroxyacylglutathione hydrolase
MLKRIGDVVLIQLSSVDSNIYMAGDTVIDTGTGFNFTRLHTILRVLKKDFKSVKHVINTHGHFDHIGGNGYFLAADLAIHQADAPIIEDAHIERSWADYFDGKLKPRKVDRKLKEGDMVQAGPLNLRVLHTPGHSPGSICLHDESKGVLFSGDAVFSDGVGRTDGVGCSEADMVRTLDRLSQLSFKTLLPGHGEAVKDGADKAFRQMLNSPGPAEEDD